jgi:hypothetical protein
MRPQVLIDRYVNDVVTRLPRDVRNRAAEELRVQIIELLDDAAAEAGRAPDRAMVRAVLRSVGRPANLAAAFLNGGFHVSRPVRQPFAQRGISVLFPLVFVAVILLIAPSGFFEVAVRDAIHTFADLCRDGFQHWRLVPITVLFKSWLLVFFAVNAIQLGARTARAGLAFAGLH